MPHSKGADGNVFAYAAGPVPEKRVFGSYILPGHNPASQIGDADYDKKEFAYDLARRVEVATDQKGSFPATSDCLDPFPSPPGLPRPVS